MMIVNLIHQVVVNIHLMIIKNVILLVYRLHLVNLRLAIEDVLSSIGNVNIYLNIKLYKHVHY